MELDSGSAMGWDLDSAMDSGLVPTRKGPCPRRDSYANSCIHFLHLLRGNPDASIRPPRSFPPGLYKQCHQPDGLTHKGGRSKQFLTRTHVPTDSRSDNKGRPVPGLTLPNQEREDSKRTKI